MKTMPFPSARSRRRIVEQIGDFSRREVRGRLVEDQQFGVAQDCLEDLHPLPAAERQRGDERVGVEVEAEAPACFAHPRRHRARF